MERFPPSALPPDSSGLSLGEKLNADYTRTTPWAKRKEVAAIETESLTVSYSLTRAELERALRAAPGFRRQLAFLACMSLPSVVLLAKAPQFEWWMVPPVVLLLALGALKVPKRTARRLLAGKDSGSGSLQLNARGLRASGAIGAQAAWSELVAVGEDERFFQFEISLGPVVVLPKRCLADGELDRVRRFAAGARRLPRWPVWAMVAVAVVLAVGILLSLEWAPLV